MVGIDLASRQNIKDDSGNTLALNEPEIDQVYLLDNTVPEIAAITRLAPAEEQTCADTLVFRVVFSEAVWGVDETDFSVSGTTGSITGITQVTENLIFELTLSGGDLADYNGTVAIALDGGQNIADESGNALSTKSPAINETYTLDNLCPTVTINQAADQSDPATSSPVDFTVVFSETVTGFTADDVDTSSSTTPGTLAVVVTDVLPGDGTTYTVSVSGMKGSGNVIATVDAGAAEDGAGLLCHAGTSTDNTVIYYAELLYTLSASHTTVTEGGCRSYHGDLHPYPVRGEQLTKAAAAFTMGGTAELDIDYTNIGGTGGASAVTGAISFLSGETQKTITLDVTGDTTDEPDKTLMLTLSGGAVPGGLATFANNPISVDLPDDDVSLVINEVDYDQGETDSTEFIEILNISQSQIDLGAYTLVLVDSTGSVYLSFQLSGTLSPGDYFVVCNGGGSVSLCNFETGQGSDFILDAGPGALALCRGTFIVDTLSYEGDTPGYTEGTGVSVPADGGTSEGAGLSRDPDGEDTNDNQADFTLRRITPGLPNTDTDGDGMPDCVDGCPDDPEKTDPGTCGCHVPDTDSDDDGTPNCIDYDSDSDNDGLSDHDEMVYGTDPLDPDSDGDGALDKDEIDAGSDPLAASQGPGIPEPVSPENQAAPTELPVELLVAYGQDADAGLHQSTRWQVAYDEDFSVLVMDIVSDTSLLALALPVQLLAGETGYFWRARFIDTREMPWSWSGVLSFTSPANGYEDENGNGLPDDQEPSGDVGSVPSATQGWQEDLYWLDTEDNGQGEAQQTCLRLSDDNSSLVYFGQIQEGEIQEASPDGLVTAPFSVKIDVLEPGTSTLIQLYFSPALSDASDNETIKVYKYDTINGWVEYTDGWVEYISDTDEHDSLTLVTLEIVDGGKGDADGVENGVIVDPVGIVSDDDTGGSDGHCFIQMLLKTTHQSCGTWFLFLLITGAAAAIVYALKR